MTTNPILNFEIDKSSVQYIGHDLQRPECILAEPDGTLWSADARGGVVRIQPDGTQDIITQKRSGHFSGAGTESSRYLEGTLPNGLAFARNGDFRIVADGFHFTNEIRFDAKEEFLYVVETTGGRITRLRIDEHGKAGKREIFGPTTLGKGAWPDGIAFDSYGNL